jgi:serine protease AprX
VSRRLAGRALAALTTGALASAALGVTPASADTGALGYDALTAKGALYNIAEVVGAHASYAAGFTGEGVGVALIDTDVVAPGVSVPGLRVPDGFADSLHPDARVGTRFAKASGTSQAAAVVSGEVALLLQESPSLTPDQVKKKLMNTAENVPLESAQYRGNGVSDARTAQVVADSAARQTGTAARGTGSLEASRGSSHVSDGGTPISGEVDVFGHAWDGTAWAAAPANEAVWVGGTWRGLPLVGDGWDGRTWRSADWSGQSWNGQSWTGQSWSGGRWSGGRWSGDSWRTADLAGASWS